ncbi:MAG: hypothetical protein WKF76_06105 [Nocardioidaceae bacterium]
MRPQGDGWESASVYNPAAIVKDDRVVLLYRAHADDIVSHVGLASQRRRDPASSGIPSRCSRRREDYEHCGCEDPRVTEVGGIYYLTYTRLGQ